MSLKKLSYTFIVFTTGALGLVAAPAQAANFCVDDLADGPPVASDCNEVCHPTPTCSLRDAIQAANADGLADTIAFGIDGKIVLTGTEGNDDNSSGDLDILQGVQITGNGVVQTVIDGGGMDRVFDVLTPGTQVSISDLTIQNGDLSLPSGGAGIQNQAVLDLQNLQILNNQISAPINSANQGGGILNSGSLTLGFSSLQGNSAEAGGGLSNSGSAEVSNSTFAENEATIVEGGGVDNVSSGDLILTNCTLSGNFTPGFGGGLNNDATIQIFNSTIANNSANTDNDGSGDGGGISIDFFNDSFAMTHTLVADNEVGTGGAANPDCFSAGDPLLSGGFNLVEDRGNCSGFIASDLPEQDPQLAILGNNGGSTPTQPLLPGSPAIDAGNPSGCEDVNGNELTQDQRASLRPVDGLGNGGTAICDIGATEYGADVAVTKADSPDPVFPEDVFNYNIQVINNGPDTAENVVLTDNLPNDIEVFGITSVANCQQQGRTVTCSLGDMASGKIVAVFIQAFAPDFETNLENSASVTSQAGDYNLANNNVTIETGVFFDEDDSSGCSLSRTSSGGVFSFTAFFIALFALQGFRLGWRR